MKIALLTLGTRGDVEPFAALGKALQAQGHQVCLSTGKNFEDLVQSYGVDFVPVEADYQTLLQSDEGKKIMKANPFAIRRNLNQVIYPLVRQSLQEFYNLAIEQDRVVYHVKTMADCFADQFPEKMIRAMVVPAVQATQAFPNPAFSGFAIPKFLNKWSYKLSDLAVSMMKKPITQFRESAGLSLSYKVPETKFIYGISERFLNKPDDFPVNSYFTGFWTSTSKDELSPELTDFIQAGESPLLLTFGSMPFKSKFNLQTGILKVVEQLNTRIIVIKGWGLEQTDILENNPNVLVIQGAPYDRLFPFVKAVIHHGGAGTTAACLKAGKPFFICPILYPVGDQLFWGNLAHGKGLAVKPIPVSKMTESKFIAQVKILLEDEDLYRNCQKIQAQLDVEDGVQNALDLILP